MLLGACNESVNPFNYCGHNDFGCWDGDSFSSVHVSAYGGWHHVCSGCFHVGHFSLWKKICQFNSCFWFESSADSFFAASSFGDIGSVSVVEHEPVYTGAHAFYAGCGFFVCSQRTIRLQQRNHSIPNTHFLGRRNNIPEHMATHPRNIIKQQPLFRYSWFFRKRYSIKRYSCSKGPIGRRFTE